MTNLTAEHIAELRANAAKGPFTLVVLRDTHGTATVELHDKYRLLARRHAGFDVSVESCIATYNFFSVAHDMADLAIEQAAEIENLQATIKEQAARIAELERDASSAIEATAVGRAVARGADQLPGQLPRFCRIDHEVHPQATSRS